MLIWMAGTDKQCTYVNQGWLDFTGRTLEQELGDGWAEGVHRNDYDRCLKTYVEAFDRREPFAMEYRLRRADGRYGWILDRGMPLWGDDGQFRGYIGACVDITDSKEVEARLIESETRFKALADSAPVLMWMNDQEGAWFTNRAYLEFLGVRGQVDVEKYDWTAFVHPEDRDRYLHAYHMACEQQTLFDEQFRFRRHDGCYRWMRSVGQPRYATAGEVLGYVGVTYDITPSMEAQQSLERWGMELERAVNVKTAELQQSQERLRALATELNLTEQREGKRLAEELHDHLAQMLVLIGYRLAQAKKGPVDHGIQMIEMAEKLLADSLAYTRNLVVQLCPPVLHEFGLPVALRWLAEQMRRYELAVTLHITAPDDVPLAEEEAILLFQSTRELLINVAKHAAAKEATLTMAQREGLLQITVEDRGVGFEAALSRLKDRSKFGLFSIAERMHALGGRFDLETTPGKGATASLTIPMLRRHAAATSTTAGEAVRGTGSALSATHCRVLIVDDHAMLRQGLRSVLDAYQDIEVIGEAANGKEAVDMARQLDPTVIVMDINMPLMNGIEATAKIKSRQPHIMVIGLSVNASPETSELMRAAGARLLLTKEAAVDQLHDAIRATVGTSPRESLKDETVNLSVNQTDSNRSTAS